MSTPPDDPTFPFLSLSSAPRDRRANPAWLPGASLAALLALADFGAVALVLARLVARFQHDHDDAGTNVSFMLPSDLATPFLERLWLLVLVNGLLLCVSKQTRATGIGLVAAAAAIAVPVLVWVVWTLATFTSG